MRSEEFNKERRFAAQLEKTFGRQQADDLLGKFFQVKYYEGKTFFEKKVLPLKHPFPKNFSKKNQATNGSGFWQARGSADWERRLAAQLLTPHSSLLIPNSINLR